VSRVNISWNGKTIQEPVEKGVDIYIDIDIDIDIDIREGA